jgi:hypothetical protein
VDALTSQEDGTRTAIDETLLARSTELGRILVTQDEDFLQLAAAWQSAGRRFTGIAFAPQQGASVGRHVDDLELIAQCATEAELENLVTYLPLK